MKEYFEMALKTEVGLQFKGSASWVYSGKSGERLRMGVVSLECPIEGQRRLTRITEEWAVDLSRVSHYPKRRFKGS